ncbi:MAG: hypothetical protein J0H68_08260 [Sphingobacteriia bacterium]|nr:hypothetical protein [Sphingobacteriia bacterium]
MKKIDLNELQVLNMSPEFKYIFSSSEDDNMKNVDLKEPLVIDVQELSKYLPESMYISPKANHDSTCHSIMQRNSYNTVIGFDFFRNGGFNRIRSEFSTYELAYILHALPAELYQKIYTALKDTILELPIFNRATNKRIIDKIEEEKRIENEKETLLKKFQLTGLFEENNTFNLKECKRIYQRFYGITAANSKLPVLASFGAFDCIILTLYNPETKVAALAHIDTLTDLNSIESMLRAVRRSSYSKIEVSLVGGANSTKQLAINLIETFNDETQYLIKSTNLINGQTTQQLAIDARTGKIFTTFDPSNLNLGPDYNAKSVHLENYMRCLVCNYDGRTDLIQENNTNISANFRSLKENEQSEEVAKTRN